MICRNTVGQNFGSGADITREHEARTMQSGKKKDIHLHGCIIREEISIITNTGSIIMSMRERTEGFWTGMKMPVRYVVEMFLDRIAASKVYIGEAYNDSDPLRYYENGRAGELMHPETRALLEKLLHMLAEKGEEETYRYIRREVLRKKEG